MVIMGSGLRGLVNGLGSTFGVSMAAIFIAQATNTPMTLTQQITLLAVLLLTSKGAAGVTGLIMTKLDGTARGGILVALAEKHKLPVHFIGVGEGIDDLAPFTARDFAKAIAGIDA